MSEMTDRDGGWQTIEVDGDTVRSDGTGSITVSCDPGAGHSYSWVTVTTNVTGQVDDGVGPSRFTRWLDIRDSEDELQEFFSVLAKNGDRDSRLKTETVQGLEQV